MILTKPFPDNNDPDEATDHDNVQARYDDDEEDDGPSADPQLEGGMPLPIRLKIILQKIYLRHLFLISRLAAEFPPELTAIPLEDIDPYYQNKKVTMNFIPIISMKTENSYISTSIINQLFIIKSFHI